MQLNSGPELFLDLICPLFSVCLAKAGAEIAFDPVYLVGIAIGVFLLLLVAGFIIWRTMFAAEQTDFSAKYQENESSESTSVPSNDQGVLNRDAVSKSADTVSTKADEAIIERLRERPSARPTVDAMSDLSVSTEEDDDEAE